MKIMNLSLIFVDSHQYCQNCTEKSKPKLICILQEKLLGTRPNGPFEQTQEVKIHEKKGFLQIAPLPLYILCPVAPPTIRCQKSPPTATATRHLEPHTKPILIISLCQSQRCWHAQNGSRVMLKSDEKVDNPQITF